MSKAPDAQSEPTAEILGATVLLVEDDALLRTITADNLREDGYRVLEAEDAAHAISVIATAKIDVVFTDVHMPGDMDGCALAGWTQRHYPDVGILVTSGKAQSCEILDELEGNIRIIPKPYSSEALNRRIREIMAAKAASD